MIALLVLLSGTDPAGTYQAENGIVVIASHEGGYAVQWFWCSPQQINYVGWIRRTQEGWLETWNEAQGVGSGTLVWRFWPGCASYGGPTFVRIQ